MCAEGLNDLAIPPPTETNNPVTRFDLALELFATGGGDVNITPSTCDLPDTTVPNNASPGGTLCDAEPVCQDFPGPGGFVVFRAMTQVAKPLHDDYSMLTLANVLVLLSRHD